MRHGFRATAETRRELLRAEASLEAEYRARLEDSGDDGLRRGIALLEALLDRFLAENELSSADALAVAIEATAQIAALKERQARLERRLTPVSVQDLRRFLRGVDDAVARFVAPDMRDEFYQAIRRRTGAHAPSEDSG